MPDEEITDDPFADEDEVPQGPQESTPGKPYCRICPSGPFSNTQGRLRHEKRMHPEESAVAKAGRDLTKATGGIPSEVLTERAKEFAEVLDAAAPDLRTATRKQIVQAFEDESDDLIRDSVELENFLNDYGLKLTQIRQIRRRLIGRKGTLGGGMGGSQQTMAYNPATGQAVPIIMMPSQGGSNSPPVIVMGSGEKADSPPGLTRDDVTDIIERVLDRRDKDQAPPPPVPMMNMRMYQEPMIDPESGQPVLDSKGQMFMRVVQEPIDPISSALSMLKETGLLNKETPPVPPSADEIASKLKDAVSSEEKGPSSEVIQLQRSVDGLNAKLETREAVREALQENTDALMARFLPQLEQLKDLQSKSGLSDAQAESANQREMSRDMLRSLENFREGVRGDLQPLVFQMAAANMKSQGFSDQAITDILRTPATNGASSSVGDMRARQAASTMQNWIKE